MSHPLPFGEHDDLSPGLRRGLVVGVLVLHLSGAWALLQVPSVREAVHEAVPLMVDLIAAPPLPRPREPDAPARPEPPVKLIKRPPPVVATTATPAAPRFVAPPPVETPAPPVEAPPVRDAAPAVAAPAESAPREAASDAVAHATPPKSIPATAVQYIVAPAPDYPARSRRLGESGKVVIRVEIDATGHAQQVQVLRSSGFSRLDESALAAVRAARFKPYTDNGVPQPVWSTVPIVFELEN